MDIVLKLYRYYFIKSGSFLFLLHILRLFLLSIDNFISKINLKLFSFYIVLKCYICIQPCSRIRQMQQNLNWQSYLYCTVYLYINRINVYNLIRVWYVECSEIYFLFQISNLLKIQMLLMFNINLRISIKLLAVLCMVKEFHS